MKNKKVLKITSFILAFVLVVGASLAYFTDFATTSTNGTAGTVAVSLNSDINLLDSDGRNILNPGDLRTAGFEVQNEGNKSIDVRTTIVLTTQSETHNLSFTGSPNNQSEYDLYLRDDVELVEGKGYAPKAGAQPIQVKSIDNDTITYILPEYSLNGNSDRYNEVETIDGISTYNKYNDYVLIFKGESGNEWQNSSISIDVLVEAKQHENTSTGWEIVGYENVITGAINKNAVKGENIITETLSNNSVVNIPVTSVDSSGNSINVTSTLIKGEKANEVLTTLNEANIQGFTANDVDALIEVSADNFEGSATTTFDVSNIANVGDTVVILHYDETKQEWEYITTAIVDANGTVSGTFSSFSPVAFIVNPEENKKEKVNGFLYGVGLVRELPEEDSWYTISPIASELFANVDAAIPNITLLECDHYGAMVLGDVYILEPANGDFYKEYGYSWTKYQVISETKDSVTVKLICDEADFSGITLYDNEDGVESGYDKAIVSGNLTVVNGNLEWTVTFDKEWKTVTVNVLDLGGNPVSNARIPMHDANYIYNFNVVTNKNGIGTLKTESNNVPNGQYEVGTIYIPGENNMMIPVNAQDTNSVTINGNTNITINVTINSFIFINLVDESGNPLEADISMKAYVDKTTTSEVGFAKCTNNPSKPVFVSAGKFTVENFTIYLDFYKTYYVEGSSQGTAEIFVQSVSEGVSYTEGSNLFTVDGYGPHTITFVYKPQK